MTTVEVVAVVLGVLAIVVLVAYVVTLRDTDMRSTRVGVFLDRERFDEQALERGWDREDTLEIPPVRYRPPEARDDAD